MARKPVLPADLDLDDLRTAPGAAARPPFLHEQVEPTPASSAGGLKERATATTLYLMPADHRRLRKLAIRPGCEHADPHARCHRPADGTGRAGAVERWETRRKAATDR